MENTKNKLIISYEEHTFKKADIVKERGKTTEMVVETINNPDGKIGCVWFNEKYHLFRESFDPENLIYIRYTHG